MRSAAPANALFFLSHTLPAFYCNYCGFPGGSDSKESTCNAGDLGSIPGLGRSSGGGHGNPLQYSCLENPMDRGAWQATVHRVTKSQTQLKQLSTAHQTKERESGIRQSYQLIK